VVSAFLKDIPFHHCTVKNEMIHESFGKLDLGMPAGRFKYNPVGDWCLMIRVKADD
jgi:hypothetical protein